jgi:alpha-beta hydrolase superfamily lysophospholipase
LRIETRDGLELGSWFQAGEGGRPVVLLLHGMGGSRTSLEPAAQRLNAAGFGTLALSLRSFGDSQGERLDFGWSSRADVLAAVETIEREEPGVPIVVIGQSLGAAAAIYAAPELGRRVAGWILEAPYRDIDKACRDRLREQLIAPFDDLAFLGLRLWVPLILGDALAQLRPIEYVERFPSGVPVLFVAGARDALAPHDDVADLCAQCTGQAELAILDGRDHRELWSLDERHWELWAAFLTRVESGRAATLR